MEKWIKKERIPEHYDRQMKKEVENHHVMRLSIGDEFKLFLDQMFG